MLFRNKTSSLPLSVALLLASTVGCGGSTDYTLTSNQNVAAQIEGLSDMVGNPEAFATAFVDGAAPENREDYGNYIIEIMEAPEVTGDLAVVSVKLTGGVVSSQLGDKAKASDEDNSVIETVWTVKQVGDEWKIQDAPLP